MTHVPHDAFAAFVGIDWADAKHDLCLQAAGSTNREASVLDHTPEAIDAWVCTLRQRFGGHPVAVGLELNKGPIVSALHKYEFLVLFPVNPLTLARYRAAFTPSRAKDDPTDAALQLELLLKHRDKLQPLQPQSPQMRALAQLVEPRRRLVGDKVRLTNRLTSALKNSFPHVLRWFEDKDTVIFCDFLRRWPTLKAVQLARRATLETFFRDHHVRSAEVITQRLQAIKAATPLTTDEGIMTPNVDTGGECTKPAFCVGKCYVKSRGLRHSRQFATCVSVLFVQALVAPLRATLPAIADFAHAIAPHAQQHPDFPLFQALPGAGPVFAPRLLVAFGEQRERYTSAAALQQYAG